MRTPAIVLSLVGISALDFAQAERADLRLTNGRIYTVDAARPWAEALAIRGSRSAAVGTTAEVQALAGPSTPPCRGRHRRSDRGLHEGTGLGVL